MLSITWSTPLSTAVIQDRETPSGHTHAQTRDSLQGLVWRYRCQQVPPATRHCRDPLTDTENTQHCQVRWMVAVCCCHTDLCRHIVFTLHVYACVLYMLVSVWRALCMHLCTHTSMNARMHTGTHVPTHTNCAWDGVE